MHPVARFLAAITAAAGMLLGSPPALAETENLMDWQPAQVVDRQDDIGRASALFTTTLGRAVVVYPRAGRAPWGSSRPDGDASWEAPRRLEPAPDDGSGGPVEAGPVAVGSGGGGAVFLESGLGELSYVSLSPQGEWSVPRPFPYTRMFDPQAALVRPGSGIVAVGSGNLGGQVRAAVKPQGGRWQLSPRLDLAGRKLVRGAWYGADGRTRVLLAVAQRGDVHRREMFTVALRLGSDGPRWGRAQIAPRGTEGGTLADLHGVSMVSNPDGATTVQWLQNDEGFTHWYVRHRDPVEGWTPVHLLPDPPTGQPSLNALAPDGTTRLSYLTSKAEGEYTLVTRFLGADGTLGEEQVVDTFAADNVGLDQAPGSLGDVLLRWQTNTGTAMEQHVFRCPAGSDCTPVGTWSAVRPSLLAVAPDGTGFMAGAGDAVPGCPSDALCSRRLPATGADGAPSDRTVSEVVVRPARLPRGALPKISWLVLNVVHTPNGRAHKLPWTEKGSVDRVLRLYGRTPEGWVVTDHELGDGSTGWVVDGKKKRALDQDSESNDEHTWMVARDGSAVLKREYTEGSTAGVMVTRISDGARLGLENFDGRGDVYDFSGPQALLGVDGDTVLWEPGGDSTLLGTPAVAGDLLHDILVVPSGAPGMVGPTTISDPGTPSWTAPLEYVEVSPNGRLLLGRVSGGSNAENHFEVRRVSDGEVVAAFDLRNVVRIAVRWESPGSIIFISGHGLDQTGLVRCRLDGTCSGATAWRHVDWFSFSMVRAPQVVG